MIAMTVKITSDWTNFEGEKNLGQESLDISMFIFR